MLPPRYGKKEHFDAIVQAGVRHLQIHFEDAPLLNRSVGYEVQLESHPEANDTTDQFITRFIGGEMLTEQVTIRLSDSCKKCCIRSSGMAKKLKSI